MNEASGYYFREARHLQTLREWKWHQLQVLPLQLAFKTRFRGGFLWIEEKKALVQTSYISLVVGISVKVPLEMMRITRNFAKDNNTLQEHIFSVRVARRYAECSTFQRCRHIQRTPPPLHLIVQLPF